MKLSCTHPREGTVEESLPRIADSLRSALDEQSNPKEREGVSFGDLQIKSGSKSFTRFECLESKSNRI